MFETWGILIGLVVGVSLLGRWYAARVLRPRYRGIVERACGRLLEQMKEAQPPLLRAVGVGSPEEGGQCQRILLVFAGEAELTQIEEDGQGIAYDQKLRQALLAEGYPMSMVGAVQIEWLTSRGFKQAEASGAVPPTASQTTGTSQDL